MLQKLGDHIKACLSRAEACKVAGDKATDPEVRKQLTELGMQWEHAAKSYEFIESASFWISRGTHYLTTWKNCRGTNHR